MRAPDLKAPRCRTKFHSDFNRSLLKRFKAKYPQYSHYDDEVLINSLKMLNKLICQHVVDSRDGVELPSGMGYLFIQTNPPVKDKQIDFKKSIELGTKVRFNNWDTDNKLCKIVYSNYGCRLANRSLWGFTAVRQFKRAVPKTAAKNWTKYITNENYRNISELVRKSEFKDKVRARHRKELLTYSEFDI